MNAPLELTAAECQYLVLELPVELLYEGAGGPDFRVQFLTVRDMLGTHEFRLTENELWLLDRVLRPLARTGKLPDGTPVMPLIERIWGLLVDIHTPDAVAMLRQQGVLVRDGGSNA